MTSAAPHPIRVFRLLAGGLALFALGLAPALFGVRMEDPPPANGVITSTGLCEARARRAGLVEPGWPEAGGFHRLQAGDVVSAGHVVATVKSDDSIRISVLEGLLRSHEVTPEALRELAGHRA